MILMCEDKPNASWFVLHKVLQIK